MHLVLDISLSVAKPWLHAPSGIDRVETAHARHWHRTLPERDLTFVMRNAWGRLAAIPHALAQDILAMAEERIASGLGHREWSLRARPALVMTRQFFGEGRGRLRARATGRKDSVLLSVSNALTHHHAALAAIKATGCRFVPLVHDVIPLDHPHCFPAGESERHARRMEGVSRFADAALLVSAAARDALGRQFAARGWRLPEIAVAHPGLDLPGFAPGGAPEPAEEPRFVLLGSLEPRKNHLLLLEIWREMAAELGPACPRLVVVGRRPSEPHLGTLLLDRGDFRGRVEYRGRLPDGELAALLRGARALLFPSLDEGFGIPLAEALAMGVPVIASDIRAFREVGGDAPDFLHPLDGAGWRKAVEDFAAPGSPSRAAQLRRAKEWTAPDWDQHFSVASKLLERVAALRDVAAATRGVA
jgi:glycosyltransferase involved in cell wall biosynthesis